VCPEDTKFMPWIEEKEEFTEEETALIMQGTTRDKLPAITAKKLEYLDLIDSLDSLPRNLSVFFRKGHA
jgi:epoxyqueuosine reductase